ncbi:MAG: hypothetical protein ABIB04_04945 [Patescibacteria group bacterium]
MTEDLNDEEWACHCECHDPNSTKKEIAHSTPCCSLCTRCGIRVKAGKTAQEAHLKQCLTIPPERILQKFASSSIFPEAGTPDTSDLEEDGVLHDFSSESGIIDVEALPDDLFYRQPKK